MWLYGALPLAAPVIQSAALGGSAITPQAGTLKPDRSVLLTTSAVTCGTGTLVAATAKPLASFDDPIDTKATFTAGNVGATQSDDTPIFGESSTVFAGYPTINGPFGVAAGNTQLLSGIASTSSAGSVGVENKPTQIVLGAITVSAGTVTPSGFDVTVNLNAGEVEMVGSVGSLKTASPITTSAITSALNSFAAVLNTPTDTMLGIGATFSQGIMTANQDVEDTFIQSALQTAIANPQIPLTTILISASQGNVTDTEDITLELTGEGDLAEAGSFGFSREFPLTGAEAIGEQYFVGAPGYADLTGAESIASPGTMFDGDDRDYPLTGEQATFDQNRILTVDFLMQPLDDNLITSEQYLFYKEAALTGEQISVGQGRIKAKGKDDGAGKPKKKKVTVDGQVFEVDDEELKELLVVAREIATAKAKEEADAAVAAKSTEKIKLKVPKVEGSEELKDAIADIYMQATIDAEVSRNRQLDEEEALVLLLLN